MSQSHVVRGHYSNHRFISDGPLPDVEGTAELIIVPTVSPATGSIADAFGKASRLRTGEEIAAQIQAERNEWGRHTP